MKEGSLRTGLRSLPMQCSFRWRRHTDYCLLVSLGRSPGPRAFLGCWAAEDQHCPAVMASGLVRPGHDRQSTFAEGHRSGSAEESGAPWSRAHPAERQKLHMDVVLEHGPDEARAQKPGHTGSDAAAGRHEEGVVAARRWHNAAAAGEEVRDEEVRHNRSCAAEAGRDSQTGRWVAVRSGESRYEDWDLHIRSVVVHIQGTRYGDLHL